jgi:hypothetical protein
MAQLGLLLLHAPCQSFQDWMHAPCSRSVVKSALYLWHSQNVLPSSITNIVPHTRHVFGPKAFTIDIDPLSGDGRGGSLNFPMTHDAVSCRSLEYADLVNKPHTQWVHNLFNSTGPGTLWRLGLVQWMRHHSPLKPAPHTTQCGNWYTGGFHCFYRDKVLWVKEGMFLGYRELIRVPMEDNRPGGGPSSGGNREPMCT